MISPRFALALAALVPACTDGAPETALRLSDTGLYSDIATGTLHPDVLPFTPQYPLWSDGAAKRRWIRLPPGSAIDAADPDAWDFPVGTRLWKEFAFDRRVETRLIERRPDGWHFAAYVWNDDGSEALLAPDGGVRGAWRSPELRYDVPSRNDCRACHEGGPATVLGFSALQLSPDRDPRAPHVESPAPGSVDLAELDRRGLLRDLPRALRESPPRIAARSPVERAALGYLHGNCASCHNARGPLADLGLDFAWRAADSATRAIETSCDRESRFRPAAIDVERCVRIARGEPELSVILHRLRAHDPVTRMPPLGTRIVDDEAVGLLTEWIRSDLIREPSDSRVMERRR